MKVKVVLTKGFKNKKITRTLNLGNNTYSKTAQSSLKDLTLPISNNNIMTKKINNSKNKNNTYHQTNSKNKNSHTIIDANEKSLNKNLSQIDEDIKQNQIPDFKNSTITNINPFQKVKILQEEKRKIKTRENSYTNPTLKKFNTNNNFNYTPNLTEKDKRIYLKTPIRIRRFGGCKACLRKMKNESLINRQYLNTVYFNNIEKNNNSTTIINLKKEIDLLKKENLYKTMLINNMKQQIDEYQKHQQILQENNILKEEIEFLKTKYSNSIYNNNNIGKDNSKILDNNESNTNIDLFDKLKYEYFNIKNQMKELKKENNDLKNELSHKVEQNNKIIKNIEIILKGKSNPTKVNNNNNFINNNLNDYIENKYKLILQKEKEDINNYYKPLKEEQKNEIRYLIKMTLNSNNISKDIILNFFINNLTDLNNIIINITNEYLKTNSNFDKVLLRQYFTSLCIDEKNKNFNINNLFNEINYYYEEIEKEKNRINSQKINNYLSNNEKIKKLINECKLKDQFNNGIIELNQFNEIFIGEYGNFIKNEKNKDLYDLLIYVMKNYCNLNNLGLYHLRYLNLDNNIFQQRLSSSKSVNNKENDFSEKSVIDSHEFYNKNLNKNLPNSSFNSINISENISNSKNSSSKNINNNKVRTSKEDFVADVSINVEQSTTMVNVKFKNHNESDMDNNSEVQTSNKRLDINENNEKLSIKKGNKNDNVSEKNLISNEDYQVCMDFVENVFQYCIEKLHRDEKSVYKCK